MPLLKNNSGVFCWLILGVFLFSTTATFLLYNYKKTRDRQQEIWWSSLSAGKVAFWGISGKRCVALISRHIKEQPENLEIGFRGVINLTLSQLKLPVRFEFQSYFNSMGQLIGAYLNVGAPHHKITIGTLGINPIQFIARGMIGKQAFAVEDKLPGPVELHSRGRSRRILKFTGLPTGFLSGWDVPISSLGNTLDFQLLPAHSFRGRVCPSLDARGRRLSKRAMFSHSKTPAFSRSWAVLPSILYSMDISAAWHSLHSSFAPLISLPNKEARP